YGLPSVSDFFFSSRRRHTRFSRDWSSDVCSSDLEFGVALRARRELPDYPERRADTGTAGRRAVDRDRGQRRAGRLRAGLGGDRSGRDAARLALRVGAGRGFPSALAVAAADAGDRKSTRLKSSHVKISYAVFW